MLESLTRGRGETVSRPPVTIECLPERAPQETGLNSGWYRYRNRRGNRRKRGLTIPRCLCSAGRLARPDGAVRRYAPIAVPGGKVSVLL